MCHRGTVMCHSVSTRAVQGKALQAQNPTTSGASGDVNRLKAHGINTASTQRHILPRRPCDASDMLCKLQHLHHERQSYRVAAAAAALSALLRHSHIDLHAESSSSSSTSRES
jgi:hypothetical protein